MSFFSGWTKGVETESVMSRVRIFSSTHLCNLDTLCVVYRENYCPVIAVLSVGHPTGNSDETRGVSKRMKYRRMVCGDKSYLATAASR